MLIHKIIGIENEKGIKGIRIILFNVLKYEIKCVSFADFCQIVSFVDDCSRMSCNFGGFVRAVIRRNKNANSARVILRKQSPDAVSKRFSSLRAQITAAKRFCFRFKSASAIFASSAPPLFFGTMRYFLK